MWGIGTVYIFNGIFNGTSNRVGLPEGWTGEQRPGDQGALAPGTFGGRVLKEEEPASRALVEVRSVMEGKLSK